MAVKKAKVAKPKASKPTRRWQPEDVADARVNLRRLAGFLNQQARHAILDVERRRLHWAGVAIRAFLQGRPNAKTLDHAFGVIRPRGNRSGDQVWAERAAIVDREGLKKLDEISQRFGVFDAAGIKRGLARGRAANSAVEVKAVAATITARLRAEDEKERAKRVSAVESFNRKNRIRTARKR